MTKTVISIAAQNTFTTEMNCPRDSVLVVVTLTGLVVAAIGLF